MKKLIAMVLCFVLALTVIGCGAKPLYPDANGTEQQIKTDTAEIKAQQDGSIVIEGKIYYATGKSYGDAICGNDIQYVEFELPDEQKATAWSPMYENTIGILIDGEWKEYSADHILQGIILEIADGSMIVEPIEGAWERSSSDRFIVPIEHMTASPEPQVGDVIEITYDGRIEELYPARLPNIQRIDVFKPTANEKELGDTPIIIDGVDYTNTHEAVPVEPDESAIEYVEIPVGGGSTISAFARLEEGALMVCRIDGEWYKFQMTVPGGQPADGILIPYSQQADGTWLANGISYQYRLEIAGRMPNASTDSTFVYLSNLESISFEQAYKAAGFSSNMDDYFPVEDAVLVEWTLK